MGIAGSLPSNTTSLYSAKRRSDCACAVFAKALALLGETNALSGLGLETGGLEVLACLEVDVLGVERGAAEGVK